MLSGTMLCHRNITWAINASHICNFKFPRNHVKKKLIGEINFNNIFIWPTISQNIISSCNSYGKINEIFRTLFHTESWVWCLFHTHGTSQLALATFPVPDSHSQLSGYRTGLWGSGALRDYGHPWGQLPGYRRMYLCLLVLASRPSCWEELFKVILHGLIVC